MKSKRRGGSNIIPFRKARRWTKASSYAPTGRRGVIVGILAGAIAIGAGAGAFLGWIDPQSQSVAPPQHKPEVIIPDYSDEPGDAEWQARAMDQVDGAKPAATGESAGPGLRFGYCQWGGGRNCVVDGDTFFIGGEKVRIAGIDAPETHDYRCDSELELGTRSARRLQALLNSGEVTMSSIDRDRDRYGRLLRNVAVNGRDVGETLVSEGLARPYAGGKKSWCR